MNGSILTHWTASFAATASSKEVTTMTATTNLSSYLKHCITRWYDNAKIDYDVNVFFNGAATTETPAVASVTKSA